MQLVAQDKLTSALEKEYPGLTRERKEALVAHIRSCRPENREATHKILSVHLPEEERAFYHDIVIDEPVAVEETEPAAVPSAPAPAPEAAATAVTEGAHSAESHAQRSRSR